MGTAVVRRPTEGAAIGRAGAPRVPSLLAAFEGLAAAERAGDRHGARLCRCLVQRAARDGRVGE